MDCRDAELKIHAKIDGRANAADAEALARHVSSCAACASLEREMLAIETLFAEDRSTPPPVGLSGRIMAGIREGRAPSNERRPAASLAWSRPFAIAAGLLLMLGTAFYAGRETASAKSDPVAPELEKWVDTFIAKGADRAAVEKAHADYQAELTKIDGDAAGARDAAYDRLNAALELLVRKADLERARENR